MRKLLSFVFSLAGFFVLFGLLLTLGGIFTVLNPREETPDKPSLLLIELDGVIKDSRDFIEILAKYRKDKNIKGVLVQINSPGGVVGPSQELYDELKRTRDEYKKPVVAYCSGVAASGAYYAAAGATKIVTTPGCMMGSIGVIMQFANLERLYDWAKIQRYAITTGKYKDGGADYKAMTPEQRALFQDMLNDVLAQFKAAIVTGRKMKPEVVDAYADGRIFTGAQGVQLGFADQVGSLEDAKRTLEQMTGLGKDSKLIKGKKHRSVMEILDEAAQESQFSRWTKSVLHHDLSGRALFLMPGAADF